MNPVIRMIATKAAEWGIKRMEAQLRNRSLLTMTSEELTEAMDNLENTRMLLPYLAKRLTADAHVKKGLK